MDPKCSNDLLLLGTRVALPSGEFAVVRLDIFRSMQFFGFLYL